MSVAFEVLGFFDGPVGEIGDIEHELTSLKAGSSDASELQQWLMNLFPGALWPIVPPSVG